MAAGPEGTSENWKEDATKIHGGTISWRRIASIRISHRRLLPEPVIEKYCPQLARMGGDTG
jgi:hypothetical protein